MLGIMAVYACLRLGKRSARDAFVELKKLMPGLPEAEIAVGVSRAKEFFPPSKEEVLRMREEFLEWEEAVLSDHRY
jgi:hypothetical protein